MQHTDPLADVLDLLRVRGALMALVRAHAPWGFSLTRRAGATFHAVTEGACWVRLPDQEPHELRAGDVALLPAGTEHMLASERAGPTRPFDGIAKAKKLTGATEIVLDGRGGPTRILCAAYEYDRAVAHPLLAELPSALFLHANGTAGDGPVSSTLRLLTHELATRTAGWQTTVDRLIDVLFVHVLRGWMDDRGDDGASWLMALRDPAVARALALLHADPARAWTLDALARDVSVSRATLARRFHRLVGEPPLAYLTRWRLELAARELRDTDNAVSAIAQRAGYASEFAFSRAFSRVRGRPPGRYRVEARPGRRGSDGDASTRVTARFASALVPAAPPGDRRVGRDIGSR